MIENFLYELGLIGIIGMVIGLVITYFAMLIVEKDKTKDFKHWLAVGISLFITFVLSHIFFQITGLNTLYCKKGYACIKN